MLYLFWVHLYKRIYFLTLGPALANVYSQNYNLNLQAKRMLIDFTYYVHKDFKKLTTVNQ